MEFELNHPLKKGTDTITTLSLRDPTAGDLWKMPLNPAFGDLMEIASTVSGVPLFYIKDLSAKDAMRLAKVMSDFLENGPETGEDL